MTQNETLETLTDEFEKWCKDNKYPYMSADELLSEIDENNMQLVRSHHRTYLYDFMNRWDKVNENELRNS